MLRSCAVVLATLFAVAAAFPLPTTGVVDPAPRYQRYRASEYPKGKGFFQWWYCWIRGAGTNYAFAYSVSTPIDKDAAGPRTADTTSTTSTSTSTSSTHESWIGGKKPLPNGDPGAFGMFARVDKAGGVQAAKTVRFPLEALEVTNNFDFHVASPGGSFLKLEDLGGGNARLVGAMIGNDSIWYTSGSPDMSHETVSWNFTTTRVHGWYGQPEFELIDHLSPVMLRGGFFFCFVLFLFLVVGAELLTPCTRSTTHTHEHTYTACGTPGVSLRSPRASLTGAQGMIRSQPTPTLDTLT
jgi:hypothetical protein